MTNNLKTKIVIFTGAGTSAEAGIPTFRTKTGENHLLWDNNDTDKVCNINTYDENREQIRLFYNTVRKKVAESKPTTFHTEIKEWQNKLTNDGHELTVITQNIDNLFERSGVKNVLHVHGELAYMRCVDFKHRWFVGSDEQKQGDKCPECCFSLTESEMKEYGTDPTRIKPDVIFFGEKAPMYPAAFETLRSLNENDFLIISGTSQSVFPIKLFYNTKATLIFNDTVRPNKEGMNRHLEHQFIGPCTEQLPLIREFIDNKINATTK